MFFIAENVSYVPHLTSWRPDFENESNSVFTIKVRTGSISTVTTSLIDFTFAWTHDDATAPLRPVMLLFVDMDWYYEFRSQVARILFTKQLFTLPRKIWNILSGYLFHLKLNLEQHGTIESRHVHICASIGACKLRYDAIAWSINSAFSFLRSPS